MNIAIYDIRQDEQAIFKCLEEKLKLKFHYIKGHLTAESLHRASGCDGISVLGHSHIAEDLLVSMKEIGITKLATRTVGYNHIDLAAAAKHGVQVCNSKYGPHGVADFTVMLILMALRKYKQALFRANVNDYSLQGLQGREMKDMVIGIVGTGNIGAQVIRNLSGFGCRILAVDAFKNQSIAKHAEYVELSDLYRQADIVSLHIPLLPETRQMINRESLAQMKPGVILVNCSRGELMNVSDVIDAVESEQIGALALDVFEGEEGIYHFDRRTDIIQNRDMAYLRQFPNVTMTQHIAFYTNSAVEDMVSISVNALVDLHQRGSSQNEVHA